MHRKDLKLAYHSYRSMQSPVFLPKVAVGYVWRTASAMSYRSSRTKGQTSLSGCLATPWCRKITDIRFFQWGTVYVLETSQGVLVKRVQESVDHADSILCISENDSVHKPFLLPRDDIRSLSTIIGLVRMV